MVTVTPYDTAVETWFGLTTETFFHEMNSAYCACITFHIPSPDSQSIPFLEHEWTIISGICWCLWLWGASTFFLHWGTSRVVWRAHYLKNKSISLRLMTIKDRFSLLTTRTRKQKKFIYDTPISRSARCLANTILTKFSNAISVRRDCADVYVDQYNQSEFIKSLPEKHTLIFV